MQAYKSYQEEFLRHLHLSKGSSDHTLRAYRCDISDFLEFLEQDNIELEDMQPRDIRAYLMVLSERGLSKRTCNRKLSAVRSFLNFLLKQEVLESNVAAQVHSPKIEKRLPKTMKAKDLEAIFEAASKADPESLRNLALFELFYASGARVSEISGLNMAQLDLQNHQVMLFGKGRKERIVPLHDRAVCALSTYIYEVRQHFVTKAKEPAVFLSSRGNRLSADAIRRILKAYLLDLGLDRKLSPHAIRHAFASDILSGGADLRTVQELLGHESLSTTQIYTEVSPERLKKAFKQAHPRA